MSYGMSILTPAGDEVLDENQVLYVRASGTTQVLSGIDTLMPFIPSGSPGTAALGRQHYAGSGYSTEAFAADTLRYPTPLFDMGELAFFEMPSEGLYFGLGIETPWNNIDGTSFGVCTTTDTVFNWRVASTTPGAASGYYGMQKFNAAGDVIFDSRHEQIAVVDHFFVSQTTITDILDNDASYTLTLSKDVPDCSICMPYWAHWRSENHSYPGPNKIWYVKITQTADDELTLSRVEFLPTTGLSLPPNKYFTTNNSTPAYVGYVHDAIILVAR